MTTPLWQKVKNSGASRWQWEEGENFGLKLNIQKTKIMASNPITSRQIDGETMKDFIFWGSEITADGDCGLLLGRKAMTNLDRMLKSKDITLPTKVCLFKAMVFPVVFVCMWKLDYKEPSAMELMFLNCVVGEDSWESLGLQGDPTISSLRKSVQNILWKDWCWNWNSNNLATWFKELTH